MSPIGNFIGRAFLGFLFLVALGLLVEWLGDPEGTWYDEQGAPHYPMLDHHSDADKPVTLEEFLEWAKRNKRKYEDDGDKTS